MKPYAVADGGVRLAVRLTPRASRNCVDGIARDVEGRPILKLRLVAPPVEGAANDALIAFLAKTLSLRKADIAIRSGETSPVPAKPVGSRSCVWRATAPRFCESSTLGWAPLGQLTELAT